MEIDGARRKYERALEHMEALLDARERVNALEPFAVEVDPEPDGGPHAVRVVVRADIDLLRFSIIFGDLLHNLRSALDHAVWLVACRSTPVVDLWARRTAPNIMFPITQDPASFQRRPLKRFVAEDAWVVLDQLQPYHDTITGQGLDRLNRFCNVDKHRVLIAGVGQVDLSTVRFRPAAIDIEAFPAEYRWQMPPLIRSGDKIGEITFRRPGVTRVIVRGQPRAKIGLGNNGLNDGLMLDDVFQLISAAASALEALEALPEVAAYRP